MRTDTGRDSYDFCCKCRKGRSRGQELRKTRWMTKKTGKAKKKEKIKGKGTGERRMKGHQSSGGHCGCEGPPVESFRGYFAWWCT